MLLDLFLRRRRQRQSELRHRIPQGGACTNAPRRSPSITLSTEPRDTINSAFHYQIARVHGKVEPMIPVTIAVDHRTQRGNS